MSPSASAADAGLLCSIVYLSGLIVVAFVNASTAYSKELSSELIVESGIAYWKTRRTVVQIFYSFIQVGKIPKITRRRVGVEILVFKKR